MKSSSARVESSPKPLILDNSKVMYKNINWIF